MCYLVTICTLDNFKVIQSIIFWQIRIIKYNNLSINREEIFIILMFLNILKQDYINCRKIHLFLFNLSKIHNFY